MMSPQEFNRLKQFSYSRKHAPFTNTTSRRTSKSKSNATGQTGLKGGKIVTCKVKWIGWK